MGVEKVSILTMIFLPVTNLKYMVPLGNSPIFNESLLAICFPNQNSTVHFLLNDSQPPLPDPFTSPSDNQKTKL